MGCLEGDRPPKEQIQQLHRLVETVSEPSVGLYLEEGVCAFEAGAYSVAVVAGWCAVACYLRHMVEVIGYDVGCRYYKEDQNQDKPVPSLENWDGRPLLVACNRMQVFSENLLEKLYPFWKERCQCAHPSGEFASSEKAFDLITGAQWLLMRSIAQEQLQNPAVVYACAENKDFELEQARATRLVEHLCGKKHESLARWVLEKRLSPDCKVDSEKLLALWEALKTWLSQESRRRLMNETLIPLIETFEAYDPEKWLPSIDEVIDVAEMAKFVFWEDVGNQSVIWQYFVSRRIDLSDRIKNHIRQHAPSLYRQKIDQPVEFEEDEI